jgi:geranylgeranyl diphosphate synthase type II
MAAIGKRTGQDQQHRKLTYPALVGVDESRRRASELIEQAVEALEPFGARATALKTVAQYVLERNR